MLQGLLAERFKLAIHRESKEQAVYAMVMGKGELKIKPSAPPPAAPDGTAPNPAVTGSNSVSITQGKGGATVSDGTGKSQKMIPSPDGKSMRLEITGRHACGVGGRLEPDDGSPRGGHDRASRQVRHDAGHLDAGIDECRPGRGSRRAAPAHRRCRVRPGQYRLLWPCRLLA